MTASIASEAIAVAIGGALGCLGRYGLEHLNWLDERFWQTVITNLIGCLLIGIFSVMIMRISNSDFWSKFIITGFLGGFTTFSTFALHPIAMIRDGFWVQASTYIFVTVFGGLVLCATGMWCTDKIMKAI